MQAGQVSIEDPVRRRLKVEQARVCGCLLRGRQLCLGQLRRFPHATPRIRADPALRIQDPRCGVAEAAQLVSGILCIDDRAYEPIAIFEEIDQCPVQARPVDQLLGTPVVGREIRFQFGDSPAAIVDGFV